MRDVEILTLQHDADAISAKSNAIAWDLCQRSKNIREPNFELISSKDVGLLFGLYDERFFGGWLSQQVTRRSSQPMRFRVSSRMTKAGGTTTRRRARSDSHDSCEIAVAARLLFVQHRSKIHRQSLPVPEH